MRVICVLLVSTLAVTLGACSKAPPPNVAATVNGKPITNEDLEKFYKAQFPEPVEGSNADMVMSQKLELLGSLIINELLQQRAEKLGLSAVDADVDAELNKMRSGYTTEAFNKQLESQHLTLDDLRAQIRRKLTADKLINKEIRSHIAISDADVTDFYNANKPSFNLAEPQIHIAQILVTPFPDPNVRNLKNSKAQNTAEATQKIRDIEARLGRGEEFGMVAQNYSEDPNTAPNGGDMGFIPASSFEKASPELRKLVDSLQPGVASKPIATPDGFRILKVISREPAGQRDLQDPRVQQSIRETLMNRKDQLLTAAYYEVARNSAKIENYLARNIFESAGKK